MIVGCPNAKVRVLLNKTESIQVGSGICPVGSLWIEKRVNPGCVERASETRAGVRFVQRWKAAKSCGIHHHPTCLCSDPSGVWPLVRVIWLFNRCDLHEVRAYRYRDFRGGGAD